MEKCDQATSLQHSAACP